MLNPFMLLGLLGLGVPILIHLINRRRMKPRQLATLKFLDQEDVANAFAPLPRDMLQLLLRLLLLTLFVLLMARLTAPGRAVGPRALAIVLDNSMSMRRPGTDGRTSLFDQHRAGILQLVRGMKEGDFFSFTLVGDKVFDSTGFTNDRDALERAVTNAWVSDGSARGLYPAIEDSLKELEARRAPNMALLVFSDQQTANYRPQLGAAAGLGALLRGSAVKPVFIQDPLAAAPNVELRDAAFDPDRVYLGASAKIAAQVHNGSSTQQTVTVSLKSGPVIVGSRIVRLAGGETASVEMRQTFDSPSDTAWGVNLSDDGFNADNEAYAAVRMLKRRQVLLVASTDRYPKPETMAVGTSGPDLFSCAVNPSEATGEAVGETYISVQRIGPEQLERKALSLYSMIVLYGIQKMEADVVQDLDGYVRQGGGLCIVPDTNMVASAFNAAFEPLLGGVTFGDLREPKIAASLDTDEKPVEDPFLLGLMRGEWGTASDLRFSRYFTMKKGGQARTALRTRDGDVLLAVVPLGKGRVCVQAHSWSVEDTSLPRNLSFVSVVHAILDRLCAADPESAEPPDRIRAGDFHRMALPQFRGLGGQVVFAGPRTSAFDVAAEDAHATVGDMYIAGAYRATHPGKPSARDRWLAVNRSLEESDPSFMSAEQLEGLCGGRGGVVTTSGRIGDLFRPRRELTLLFLALVFAALAAETAGPLLARRSKEAHGPRA